MSLSKEEIATLLVNGINWTREAYPGSAQTMTQALTLLSGVGPLLRGLLVEDSAGGFEDREVGLGGNVDYSLVAEV